jgi:hypothetical protein
MADLLNQLGCYAGTYIPPTGMLLFASDQMQGGALTSGRWTLRSGCTEIRCDNNACLRGDNDFVMASFRPQMGFGSTSIRMCMRNTPSSGESAQNAMLLAVGSGFHPNGVTNTSTGTMRGPLSQYDGVYVSSRGSLAQPALGWFNASGAALSSHPFQFASGEVVTVTVNRVRDQPG